MPGYIVLDINEYDRPSRSTRNGSSDYLKYRRTVRPNLVAFKNSFFSRSIPEWNNLPLDIRELSSYDVFKDTLKAHLWSVLISKPD